MNSSIVFGMRCRTLGIAITGAAASAPGIAYGQVASAMFSEGGILAGAPGGHTVNSINNPAVNHAGGYCYAVNTSDGVTTLSHFWGNATGGAGTVLRTEGTFGPYIQASFESFHGFSDAGVSAYSPTLTGIGDSVFFGDAAVAVDGEAHPTIGGQFWTFGSRPGVTAGGVPYFVGGITSTAGGATENRGLFYGVDGGIALILGGQSLTNLPRALSTTATNPTFDYRFSADGTNYIANVIMIAPTIDDNAMTINAVGLLVDGSLVQESMPIPAAAGGQVGETWVNFDFTGINEKGDYFFSGDSNLATSADEFIFSNGQMLYRDGDVIDGQTIQGDIEAAYMNEDGDIAFIWDVAANTLEALYLNDELLLMEGDLVDLDGDGTVEANSVVANFTGIASLAVSDRDCQGRVKVYFVADIDVNGTTSTTDDIEGAFVMVAGPCTGDTNDDGQVNVADLLTVISNWGACACCTSDINGDGQVNVADLLSVIAAWGPCP